MRVAGRPLWFLAGALGSWTTVRLAIWWPSIDSVPSLIRVLAPPVAAATLTPDARSIEPVATVAPMRARKRVALVAATHRGQRSMPPPARATAPMHGQAGDRSAEMDRVPPHPPAPRQPPPLRPAPIAASPSRLAGSAWLIARGGRADALAAGQLGASQAGVRLTYALGRRIALAGRLSAPLSGRGAEAAAGVDWQPTRAPIHLVAEQRLALDGGRGGIALFAIGGLDPTPVALGFSLDAYGQAGGIRRSDGIIGFADGAARIARPVWRRRSTRLELGAGAWGGVQPGVSRIDVGPSAALVLPVGPRAVRLALDWRHRVAGRARPGSGPALSIGSDF